MSDQIEPCAKYRHRAAGLGQSGGVGHGGVGAVRKKEPARICPRTGCGRTAENEVMLFSAKTRRMEPTHFCLKHAVEVEQDRRQAVADVIVQQLQSGASVSAEEPPNA